MTGVQNNRLQNPRLQNHVAVITGAGRGIGASIASVMADEGARVVVVDQNPNDAQRTVEGISRNGGSAELFVMDVTNEVAWRELHDFIQSRDNKLDILVHNAGIEMIAPIEQLSVEQWRRVQSVNVEALLVGTQQLLPLLKDSGRRQETGASVINVSSIAAMIGFPNQAAYNTSKAAVRHLSKSMAIEFAQAGYNIRVNSIHPGFIDTPMLNEVFEEWAERGIEGNSAPAIRQKFVELQPLSRLGKPEDIAMAAVYLGASESGFVTGSELVVDGGWLAR